MYFIVIDLVVNYIFYIFAQGSYSETKLVRADRQEIKL
jgi:hypothetical protein